MPTDLPTSPPTSTYPTTQPSTTAGAIPPDTESTPAHPTLSISVSSQPTGGSMPTAVVDGSNTDLILMLQIIDGGVGYPSLTGKNVIVEVNGTSSNVE